MGTSIRNLKYVLGAHPNIEFRLYESLDRGFIDGFSRQAAAKHFEPHLTPIIQNLSQGGKDGQSALLQPPVALLSALLACTATAFSVSLG